MTTSCDRIHEELGYAEAELKRALEWLDNARLDMMFEAAKDSLGAARMKADAARRALDRAVELLDIRIDAGRRARGEIP